MAVFALERKPVFPPVELAEPDGLLAIGGDLSPERLVAAYQHGIFPWYEGDVILWWSPDPRCVLFPGKLVISKSMKQVMRSGRFRFTVNQAFEQVIHACRVKEREGQSGTWISHEMEAAYIRLHESGIAHSAEAWHGDQLVGGLYGVKLKHIFCGESMFATESNASKFAFINYVQLLEQEGIRLIDCQVHTEHLESLGAEMIPRKEFIKMIG